MNGPVALCKLLNALGQTEDGEAIGQGFAVAPERLIETFERK